MLKVLLVDDEPFILQGLQVLMDWEGAGYEAPYTASNGQEALDFLENNKVDLIIADIKMPIMNGLELLRTIREEKRTDAYYVILSGYAEFSYAQEALRYDCTDYILKPVDKENLLGILTRVANMKVTDDQQVEENRKREKAYLDRNLLAVLKGKYDQDNLNYLERHLNLEGNMCYVGIQLDVQSVTDDFSDEEKKGFLRTLHAAANEYLKDNAMYCIQDVAENEKVYDVGFLFCEHMAKHVKMTNAEFFEHFLSYLKQVTNLPITMLIGKMVPEIRGISKSYGTIYMLRSLQGFRERKQIYYYEEEYQISDNRILLCKDSLDALIQAIEQNDHNLIHQKVEAFYEEMQSRGVTGETRNLNINYFLFQLIHLASEQDSDVNQEEILRLISESTFEEGISRGSKVHLCRMASEYGDYLAQLRKNVSHGVLRDVENEVKKNYATNLTLKDLSERYYVNSAYLGQLFRKKYGCSFKDYLNQYRMKEAEKLLIRTDQKIYEIAEAVGYKDADYFVNRFIAVNGCTPAKYRKQATEIKSES